MNFDSKPYADHADAVVVEDEDKKDTGRVIFHPMEQDDETVPFVKGEVQPLEYRDVHFARAFYLQFVGVALMSVFYGSALFAKGDDTNSTASTTTTENDSDDSSSMGVFLAIVVGSLVAATAGVCGFFALMMSHTETLLRVSFFTAPALLLTFGLVLFVLDPDAAEAPDADDDGLSVGAVILIQAAVFAAISACVYHAYRKFIPFAVSTLQVASMAVRANRGLYLLSAFMPVALSAWFLLWGIAIAGVFASADGSGNGRRLEDWTTAQAGDDYDGDGPNGLAILVLLLAFYWTRYVIINVFHTTTAGTVGAWWFTPLADPALCSMDVLGSLHRSLTYSFGSICFGSLVVAVIQTLEHMAKSARGNNRNGHLVACILECLLHFLRRWVEYFNSWAFCYVGLYGYDFLTAGKNVVALFTNKGWSTFASDRLVFRVLYFANLGVAILSGGVACMVDVVAGPLLPPDDPTTSTSGFEDPDDVGLGVSASRWVAFFIGFLLGGMVSSTALFVMESVVRTVIVCFAESPAEFQECHPELCQLMRDGWAKAYPDQWAACPIVWAVPTDTTDSLSPRTKMATAAAVVSPAEQASLFSDSKGTTAYAVEKDGLFRD